jgi:hypothetical protein
VGTFDGQSVRLYLDGGQVGNGTPDTRPIVYGLTDTAPYIGTYRGGCELGFSGDIDDLRIWNSALTATETASSQPSNAGADGRGPAATPMALPPVSGPPPAIAPSCVVSVAHKTLRVGRRSSLVATVRRHAKPLKRVRVLLSGKRLRLVRRTDGKGRARFVVRPRATQRRVDVRALGLSCQNTSVPVQR